MKVEEVERSKTMQVDEGEGDERPIRFLLKMARDHKDAAAHSPVWVCKGEGEEDEHTETNKDEHSSYQEVWVDICSSCLDVVLKEFPVLVNVHICRR